MYSTRSWVCHLNSKNLFFIHVYQVQRYNTTHDRPPLHCFMCRHCQDDCVAWGQGWKRWEMCSWGCACETNVWSFCKKCRCWIPWPVLECNTKRCCLNSKQHHDLENGTSADEHCHSCTWADGVGSNLFFCNVKGVNSNCYNFVL